MGEKKKKSPQNNGWVFITCYLIMPLYNLPFLRATPKGSRCGTGTQIESGAGGGCKVENIREFKVRRREKASGDMKRRESRNIQ